MRSSALASKASGYPIARVTAKIAVGMSLDEIAIANTTAALVSAACEDISISVKVGSDAAVSGSKATISNHKLLKTANEAIVVTITYASDGDRADGAFNVSFGDLKLVYGTVD